jgi:transcriptional regulator with XRE-family HTH domain
MDTKKEPCNSAHMRFLKKLREDRDLTQYGMAKYLGMLTNTYVHYEEKAQGIKLEVLSDLRKKLDLSWNQLGKLIDEEVEINRKGK